MEQLFVLHRQEVQTNQSGVGLLRVPEQLVLVDQDVEIMKQNLVTRLLHEYIPGSRVVRARFILTTSGVNGHVGVCAVLNEGQGQGVHVVQVSRGPGILDHVHEG